MLESHITHFDLALIAVLNCKPGLVSKPPLGKVHSSCIAAAKGGKKIICFHKYVCMNAPLLRCGIKIFFFHIVLFCFVSSWVREDPFLK